MLRYLIVCFALAFASPRAMADTFLRSATITFLTGDDNKDSDTVVTVSVTAERVSFNRPPAEIAFKKGFAGDTEFNTSGRNSFDLGIDPHAAKSTIKTINTTIAIQPNGNDHWVFRADLVLNFDDGTQLTQTLHDVVLDQDHRVRFASTWVARQTSPAGAVLTQASITFTTRRGGDNKDDDTAVSVTVKPRGPQSPAIANKDDFAAHTAFNGGTSQTFDLDVLTPARITAIDQPTLLIGIKPNGHDTWSFAYTLRLVFRDDQGHLAEVFETGNGVVLDEKHRVLEVR